MNPRIYLDHSATTPIDPEVLSEMNRIYKNISGNPSSLHKAGREASLEIEKSREQLSTALNCASEDLLFVSSGTEANNLVLQGLLQEGDHLITSKIEHPSILKTAEALQKKGVLVDYAPVDKEGLVDLDFIKRSLTKKTKLISIHQANNEIGTIEPTDEIKQIAETHSVLFHTDACQSFTKIQAPSADFITVSAHKIHGPLGIAALKIKKGIPLLPQLLGGGQERNLRSGTLNTPGIVGLAKAVKLASLDHSSQMQNLGKAFFEQLQKEIEGVHLNGPGFGKNRLPNNLNFRIEGIDAKEIFLKLSERSIFLSTGAACSSAKNTPSHVLLALGLTPDQAKASLRIGLSKWTTPDELNVLLENLKELVSLLRKKL